MYVVIILILLIIFWCAYHFWSTGNVPDSFLQRMYAKTKSFISPPTPIELYKQTQGHEYNETAANVLRYGAEEEKKYIPLLRGGTIGDENLAKSIENIYAMGNITTHFLPPTQENQQRAATLRRETIHRIALRPAAAIRAAVVPETIVLNWEEDPQVQHMLLAALSAARNNTQQFERPIGVDSQNVHDTNVQSDARMILDRIREKNAQEYRADYDTTADLRRHIGENAAAMRVFKIMELDAFNSSLGVGEKTLIQEVWKRANSMENAEQQDNLRDAVVTALADGALPTGTVCVTGRDNRCLGSLTLLDSDPVIAGPMKTSDILRNEILGKAGNILQNRLQETEMLVQYNRGDTTPELDIVLDGVRAEIRQMENEYAHHKPEVVQSCIADALQGVN